MGTSGGFFSSEACADASSFPQEKSKIKNVK
jgi:hypothetical protein